jgi:hypothetical protein
VSFPALGGTETAPKVCDVVVLVEQSIGPTTVDRYGTAILWAFVSMLVVVQELWHPWGVPAHFTNRGWAKC